MSAEPNNVKISLGRWILLEWLAVNSNWLVLFLLAILILKVAATLKYIPNENKFNQFEFTIN